MPPGIDAEPVTLAFAVKALQFIPEIVRNPLVAGVLIALAAPEQRTWFVTAVTLGVIVHIAGTCSPPAG